MEKTLLDIVSENKSDIMGIINKLDLSCLTYAKLMKPLFDFLSFHVPETRSIIPLFDYFHTYKKPGGIYFLLIGCLNTERDICLTYVLYHEQDPLTRILTENSTNKNELLFDLFTQFVDHLVRPYKNNYE